MSAEAGPLEGTLVARILSDDLYGDIPRRRLAIAESIATLSEQEERSRFEKLWVLNRFRHQDLLVSYLRTLRCHAPVEIELRGESVRLYASDFARTRVVELPFQRAVLDACPDRRTALLYLANPNVARNAALAWGAARGAARTFVLDGDIYVPRPTFEQTAQLIAEHGPGCTVWLFTMRAWSLEEFASAFPVDASGQTIVDACGSEFVLNSWPPEVIRLGDEGMLGLPPDAGFFDELREYSNDPKVAYCAALRAVGRRLLTPTYPVCHLEHRASRALPGELSVDHREQTLLEHRLLVRETAKKELLDRWRPE